MESRSLNSIRNTSYAFIAQILTSIIAFVTRSVFIYTLGSIYLGLSGLFSDILMLLSLAELGFGTAITYSLYKPISQNNERKISALLNLYRHIYWIIGICITLVGLSLTPFLSFFISDMPDLPQLPMIYILYLLNTSISYFFVYKKSMLVATQKLHITSIIQIIVTLLQNLFQILTLIIFENFLIYLFIQILFTLMNNLWVSLYVDKNFIYIKKYKDEKIDKETKQEILKNVVAMFLSKFSSVVVTSTDNILISKFVSTIVLGYYSNYLLFINLIRMMLSKIFESITGSVGNLIATETKEKSYSIFQRLWFLNFWLVGFCCIMLFVIINPFIRLWIGHSYLLNMNVVFMICLNLYVRLIRNSAIVYVDTYGLFWNFRWKSIAEAIINITMSLVFIKIFDLGISGILLGTFISNLFTNFWYEPYIIYKEKFKKPVSIYFIRYLIYITVTFIAGAASYVICGFLNMNNPVFDIFLDLILCCILINGIFIVCFYKTEEFKYFQQMFLKAIKKNNN